MCVLGVCVSPLVAPPRLFSSSRAFVTDRCRGTRERSGSRYARRSSHARDFNHLDFNGKKAIVIAGSRRRLFIFFFPSQFHIEEKNLLGRARVITRQRGSGSWGIHVISRALLLSPSSNVLHLVARRLAPSFGSLNSSFRTIREEMMHQLFESRKSGRGGRERSILRA